MNIMLWAVLPYAAMVTFALGIVWRYRFDKFGWTTRSSQMYESASLRWGSPMFHFGLILVLGGHVVGLMIPKAWTEAVGISDHTYHLMAVFLGTVSGICTVVGLAVLLCRRWLVRPVLKATTVNDHMMYAVLAATLGLGLLATLRANTIGDGYDYRETVSPWLRSLFVLRPDIDLMAAVPADFQAHVLTAFALLAVWPFTRLVHAFSAPVGYLTRPYVVYRHRADSSGRSGRSGGNWPNETSRKRISRRAGLAP